MSTDTPSPARPTLDDSKVSDIADQLAAVFLANRWIWMSDITGSSQPLLYVPDVVDIGRSIRESVAALTEPGCNVSSGRISVTWEYDEARPEDQQFRVSLDLGSITLSELN
ncbi:hypothetical protein EDD29_0113 [Actinocorallia herbida]|uniref:Uncharacterized protein n=1 Tax=Actinocorallia herbida TaxID=58109 RepID=A0A3N1CMV1_9ACTN|nr:hypothetical protein [Actinocorallia herbida]ROO82632.1 hypothetical protein EDD29_0113 [Actinocorallia herbida]